MDAAFAAVLLLDSTATATPTVVTAAAPSRYLKGLDRFEEICGDLSGAYHLDPPREDLDTALTFDDVMAEDTGCVFVLAACHVGV